MTAPSSVKRKTNAKAPRESTRALARALLGRGLGFRDCPGETIDAMTQAGQFRVLAKGESLARRGAPYGMLCLVVEGSLEASVVRSDGHRHLISFLQPGDLAGIIGLLDGMGHVHDLTAQTANTTVLQFPSDVVMELRRNDPSLVRAFELQLASRNRLLYERLAADPSVPLETRLIRLLHTLVRLYGLTREDGVLLDMKIAQADLADWLGVSRQRINFVIQQMQATGLIRLRYSRITVADPAELARRAQV